MKGYVDHFHDVQDMKMDHIALARYIQKLGIHILVEWDGMYFSKGSLLFLLNSNLRPILYCHLGYARQGERAQGLMALRPSPIQVLHQEFIGTVRWLLCFRAMLELQVLWKYHYFS